MEKIIIGATERLHGHKTQTPKYIMNNNHSYSLFTTKLIVSLDFIHKKNLIRDRATRKASIEKVVPFVQHSRLCA